ncbi:MAG: hypothetical protein JKY65_21165 [Planctomycetes bacterium]|nr:hypothetical protein [Planctomycetota bacterium]
MSERGDSPENPITCHLPVGERAYLSALRCPNETAYRFRRQGSVSGTCPEPETHEGPHSDATVPDSIPVDHYELTCGCGEHTSSIYFDMYHPSVVGDSGVGRPVYSSSGDESGKLNRVDDPGQEDERAEELKTVLERHLRPGERFLVSSDDEGDVQVTPATRSVLSRTHPRFYGYLLAASQRISNSAGCGLFLFYTILGSALCFAIRNQAFHGFADGQVKWIEFLDSIRTWWVYTPVLFAALWLYWKHDNHCEHKQYELERGELADHFVREGLDCYEVLAQLEDDDEVSTISKWMKEDRTLYSVSR